MGLRGELFSTKVALQNRTYFFNVKENRLGDLYLNIVESKNKETGGFERQSVILFADDLQEFLIGFDESLKVMEKAVREKKRGPRVVGVHKTDSTREDEHPARPERSERPRTATRERTGSREGPRPYTSRRDSESPRPYVSHKDSESPRPRTSRRDSEGSRPYTSRRDSEGPRPYTRRSSESPRPYTSRRDEDRKPRARRSDDEGPRRKTFRKEDGSRPQRSRSSERTEGKPKRKVVRRKD